MDLSAVPETETVRDSVKESSAVPVMETVLSRVPENVTVCETDGVGVSDAVPDLNLVLVHMKVMPSSLLRQVF
jgi:hypothetical protein